MGERDKIEQKEGPSKANPFVSGDSLQQGQASSRFFEEFRASNSFHGISFEAKTVADVTERADVKPDVKIALSPDCTEPVLGQGTLSKAVSGFLDRFDNNPGGPLGIGIVTGWRVPGNLVVKTGVGALTTVGLYGAEKFLHINKWKE